MHCRQRRVGQKSHSKPSTSANTFWQIEKQSDSRSGEDISYTVINDLSLFTGEVISWRECCRIRHMPTRAYLAVELDKNDMGTSSVKVVKTNYCHSTTLVFCHCRCFSKKANWVEWIPTLCSLSIHLLRYKPQC